MSSEWKEVDLGEILTVKYGKDHKKLSNGEFPCYGTGGIMRMVEKAIYDDESILLPRKGSLNNIYYVNKPFWTVDTLFWSKIDKENAFPKFLFYVLSSFDLASLNVGSAVPSLTVPVLNDLKINLPPLQEQKRIAHILGTLDDKIELNRKMNETLEAMAQALFKSWFVDFDPVIDNALAAGNEIPEQFKEKARSRSVQAKKGKFNHLFPSSFTFNETLNKWIPEGWEVKTINDVTETIIDHRGKTPKKLGGDWSENGYPAISAKNIKDGKLIRRDVIRYLNEELYRKWMKEPVEKGDIIMTSEAPMGEMFLISNETKYCLSQRLYGIRADGVNTTSHFLYYWLQTDIARGDLEGRSSGTTVTGIKQSELRKVNTLSPSQEILSRFEKAMKSISEKSSNNVESIQQLIGTRDKLLPKLISGKIKV